MASLPSDEAVLKVLEEHRIATSPVMSVAESITHPYFTARGMIRTVPEPILGEVIIPGFPLKFSEFPDLLDIQVSLLGQHGSEVLRDYQGFTDREIENKRLFVLGEQIARQSELHI